MRFPQYFTIKMSEGVVATAYSSGDKFFINPEKLLPLDRFLPTAKGASKGKGGGGKGASPRILLYCVLRNNLNSLLRLIGKGGKGKGGKGGGKGKGKGGKGKGGVSKGGKGGFSKGGKGKGGY